MSEDLFPNDELDIEYPDNALDDAIAAIQQETVVEEVGEESDFQGAGNDTLFGFVLAVALSIGLTPLLPTSADLRYTLVWGALALVGVIAWLLGDGERIETETPENLAWGVAFGLLISAPFLLFFAPFLQNNFTHFIFPNMQAGSLLAMMIFVMPIAETLFFRGVFQQRLPFWMVGLLNGAWHIILFFPVMWDRVIQSPLVGISIGLVLILINVIFGYVKERNSLAAAWIAQIVVNILVLFIPFVGQLSS